MSGNLTFDELKELAGTGEIDTVLVCMVDMQGRLQGKRFHASHFVASAWKETHCCNYLLATDLEMYTVEGFAATSWTRGYGDYTMRPDMTTLRHAAWLDGTAMVLCDIFDHHGKAPVAHSPRAMLKSQIARLETMGFTAVAATELEFFLFEKSYRDLHRDGYRELQPLSYYNEDYSLTMTTREEDVMRTLRNGLYASGIPVEGSKGEAEAGQEELNLRYGPALDCAENHAVAKHATKEVGWQKGRAVSFLPKWHADRVGSAAHVHISLWSGDGAPAFYDPEAAHGLSALGRQFLGGLLKYADDLTLLMAPYINSYKRFQKGTFAPTRKVWSVDNRTAAYRLCGEGTNAVRVECRVPGSDMNPYLVLAGMIAAGIAGIEENLEPGAALTGDAYDGKGALIPATLSAATAAFRGSALMRAAFGDAVVEHYAHAADWEQECFDTAVTDWEIARGFERC